ncbi:type II toxin-antitoxin system PemK/MazF family toxin [Xanthomonas campestris pv. campestris]|nr:type II toxin-antitoxin system PemK/MazF family toxin [Xanthomonas campestris pv. campestris]MEB1309730.1 type II toxin-antitoxin system PemK/MazF family toxin [Xanthomonas campestris pv. campestris]MEB1334921.1 type II toxin-antitoxin system PemK/MazF family toxin [Xanthomonas campestris pv. campestris]
MSLTHHPQPGEIFYCKFPDEYMHGEMIKTRPVIVLSKQLTGRPRLVNIVPISMTPPDPVGPHHVLVGAAYMPKRLRDRAGDRWVKCDMIYTMSLDRLELVTGHRDARGKRTYDKGALPPALLREIRVAIASCLGIHGKLFVKDQELPLPKPVVGLVAPLEPVAAAG